ncbi:magnesium/cobalt efflux protein, partial [Xanthomonas citri pv. citri]|nr:magnesium/cobalt efflux protein [Xanthomonas citri pv. citri]
MSDEQQSVNTQQDKKSFLQSIFGGLFQSEPKNREDLVEVIRDSLDNELIDSDTKD